MESKVCKVEDKPEQQAIFDLTIFEQLQARIEQDAAKIKKLQAEITRLKNEKAPR